MPRTIGDEIQTLVDQISAADDFADSAVERTGGATGGLRDAFRRGEKLHRKLDAVVRNKYRSSAQKLAAWTIASHLELAPQPKKTEDNPPTA